MAGSSENFHESLDKLSTTTEVHCHLYLSASIVLMLLEEPISMGVFPRRLRAVA